MHRIIVVIGLLLGCFALADAKPIRMPPDGAALGLWLNFNKGQDFYAEIATDVKQNMTVMGQKIEQKQVQVFVWHVRPQGVNPQGDAILDLQIADIRATIDMGGNKVEYDSLKKNGDAALAGFFGAILTQQ